MLVQKPAALALCRELGLADEIVPTESPRTAFVLADGRLHAFPPDTRLGLPLTRAAVDGLTMLSVERARPRRPRLRRPGAAGRRRRRIGRRLHHAAASARRSRGGSPSRCSAASTPATSIACPCARSFPRWRTPTPPAAACSPRWPRAPAAADGDGAFRGLRGGMGQLPAALTRTLPGRGAADARAGRLDHARPAVSRHGRERPRRDGARRRAGRAGGGRGPARRAVRPDARRRVRRAARRVERDGDARLSARSRRASAAAGWASSCRAASRRGCSRCRGCRRSGPAARRATGVVLRAFAGGAFDADVLEAGDDALVAQTHADLAPILGISGLPVFARLHRWTRRQPAIRGRPPGARRPHRAAAGDDARPVPDRQRLSRRRHARRDRGRARDGRPRLRVARA